MERVIGTSELDNDLEQALRMVSSSDERIHGRTWSSILNAWDRQAFGLLGELGTCAHHRLPRVVG